MDYKPWVDIPTQLTVVPRAPMQAPRPRELHTRSIGEIDPIGKTASKLNATQKAFLLLHGVILVAVAYHGYRRNRNSVPWGAAWAVGALLCPSVTMAFALTQGFAKTAKAKE